jgi:ornithine carbamoyltransferase
VSHPKHFLDLSLHEPDVLRDIVDLGRAFKSGNAGSKAEGTGRGKTLALIFEKPSTRTRVSFEVGMKQLGGDVVVLTPTEMQIGRGETIADTARVLSRYVDAIMMRTVDANRLNDLARYATIPVINGLTSNSHPCQLMADVMTFEERLGPIAGRTVAWLGDGNNMACTWIQAAARFGFELRLACPELLTPPDAVVEWARANDATIIQTLHPEEAVSNADCVVTDTWVSMGDEGDDHRHSLLRPYRVDDRLMSFAKPEALFMHCLPAHREEEVTATVLDGPKSAVWDEAENRLHAQKGILSWCLS